MALTEAQRAVIMSGLGVAREFGFALAGSGALIEHGLASRPTDDADWFSTVEHAESFDLAVEVVTARLQRDGFTLLPVKRSGTFFKFGVGTPGGEIHVKAHLNGRGGFTRHHWRHLPRRQ